MTGVEIDYQKLVDFQRRRHIRGGYGWPGKPMGADAVTRYPNIAAELAASGFWLDDMAECAQVPPAIIAAVIEGGETLTDREKTRFSRGWEGRGPGYLFSPALQIVDPSTNKGKRRRRELLDFMAVAEELRGKCPPVAERAYNALQKGGLVTYAAYWFACYETKETIKNAISKPVRTERRAAG